MQLDSSQSLKVKADSFVFAAIGDYGDAGDPEREVSELVKSWSPDFIITLGDNNYPNGELSTIKANISQYYSDFIYNPDTPEGFECLGTAYEEKQNRFFPSLGNHDFDNGDLIQPYLNYFTLPGNEVFYEFKWGPVHFFALNSNRIGEDPCCESEQALWLKEKLLSSAFPFKVVFFHHSPYSSSRHGNSTKMQWPFDQWGADVILTGHNHVYERIHKESEPDLVYLVNGVGGRKGFYHCNEHPLESDIFNSLCIEGKFGAIKGIATPETLIFQFFTINDPINPVDEVAIMR